MVQIKSQQIQWIKMHLFQNGVEFEYYYLNLLLLESPEICRQSFVGN
jgi:hypothetical protein